jgi:hypothetical protein
VKYSDTFPKCFYSSSVVQKNTKSRGSPVDRCWSKNTAGWIINYIEVGHFQVESTKHLFLSLLEVRRRVCTCWRVVLMEGQSMPSDRSNSIQDSYRSYRLFLWLLQHKALKEYVNFSFVPRKLREHW